METWCGAESIPDYWMSVQSPAATESAAVAVRAALAHTLDAIDRLSDSPADRAMCPQTYMINS